jgi:hypothetical protein
MALHVDDFGCVPDGRFLEQVSIDADAAALTVSDGLLRAIDVDKNIAIPGAVDLVATIAGLVNHLIVENASMTIGGNPFRLTGTLKNPRRPAVDLQSDSIFMSACASPSPERAPPARRWSATWSTSSTRRPSNSPTRPRRP